MLHEAETPIDSNGLELGAVSSASPREQAAEAQAGVIANLKASAERQLRDLNAACDVLRDLGYPGGDDCVNLGEFMELRGSVGAFDDLAKLRRCTQGVIGYLREALTFPALPPEPTHLDKFGALRWSIDQAAWMLEKVHVWEPKTPAPKCIPTFDPPALLKHAVEQADAALRTRNYSAMPAIMRTLRAAIDASDGKGAV